MGRDVELRLGFPGHEVLRRAEIEDGDPVPWDLSSRHAVLGTRVPRQEGADKVTGRAKFTFDVNLPGMLHGRLLGSAHPAARIAGIDTSAAERAPGVRAVEILEDSEVHFAGQPVAAVAADTEEQAEDAIRLIVVEYRPRPFVVTLEDASKADAPPVTRGSNVRDERDQERGDVDALLASSDAVVEATYETQVQTHVPLEPHGIVARWDTADHLTVWCSTQGTFLVRDNLARALGIRHENVRVIAEHVGGGFGSKFGAKPFEVAACRMAQRTGRPVKLMADRKTEHVAMGNRPSSVQHMKAGAMKDGRLTAVILRTSGVVGIAGNARCANPIIYDFQAFRKSESSVQIHAGPSAAQRAPGHPQGVFALDQMVDELACAIEMDPLEFRKRNDRDPVRLAEYEIGAKEIGWGGRRKPAGAGSERVKTGIGMASAQWGGMGRVAEAMVVVHKDGGIEVFNGAQDIGTGTRSAMAVVAAEELGLPPERVLARIGITDWPDGPPSGGSNTAASVLPAVREAAFRARRELAGEIARELGVPEGDVGFEGGKVAIQNWAKGPIEWADACRLMSGERITATARRRDYDAGFKQGVAGCQFAEVEVDTWTGVVRVRKVVAVQDCGHVVNRATVESQIQGGVIQGIAFALFEDRILDRSTGHQLNPNMETYKLPGTLDLPEIVAIPFDVANGYNSASVVGLGEPPVIPTPAAIANAVFNATGKRVRRLPMTPDTVLAALEGER
ncbi:MAG: xanthine dehydrogenase family protein molybdopterin-binding subunit [Planctomycetes bacterium]|nr:xanthine dehydrogenase family protein molybdopterin-binding subunit [Planctomycetota bacterium]